MVLDAGGALVGDQHRRWGALGCLDVSGGSGHECGHLSAGGVAVGAETAAVTAADTDPGGSELGHLSAVPGVGRNVGEAGVGAVGQVERP